MIMKKTIFAILLCGVMILGITGCKKKSDILKGKWIATIENQRVFMINENGDTLGGNEDYILECDGNGNYKLILENNQTKIGTYLIEEDNSIIVKDESNLLMGTCKLSNDEDINCDEASITYALKYTKYSK